jgi:hypothetical protein
MKAYQERVMEEKAELDKKILSLSLFRDGDVYKTLASPEKARLTNQYRVMQVYSYILGERISNFE